MRNCLIGHSKGQVKIQQMAFVLVAIFILFALAAAFYVGIQLYSLGDSASNLREEKTLTEVKKISGSPEFIWGVEECSSCIDMDKAFVLKDNLARYEGFWKGISLFRIEKIYPSGEKTGVECTHANYPECDTLTLVDEGEYVGESVFVSLCRYEGREDYLRCDMGKIVMGFEPVG